jgi:hypothetical protein
VSRPGVTHDLALSLCASVLETDPVRIERLDLFHAPPQFDDGVSDSAFAIMGSPGRRRNTARCCPARE